MCPSAELLAIVPNVPEMNRSGKSKKLMIAGAASSFGTKVETSTPIALEAERGDRDRHEETDVSTREGDVIGDHSEQDREHREDRGHDENVDDESGEVVDR